MPAKRKGTKMSIADFAGKNVANYIPTSTEELESDIRANEAEKAEREARRANKAAGVNTYYGATGAAGASSSWRGEVGSMKQPDAPAAPQQGGGFGSKFGKAGGMDWGARGTAQASSTEQESKAFGGTGFGKTRAGDLRGDLSRDVFGGMKAEDSPGGERDAASPPGDRPQRQGGYNPISGPRRDEQRKREVMVFDRAAFGGSKADAPRSPPRLRAPRDRDAPRVIPERSALGTASASRPGVAVFSREDMASSKAPDQVAEPEEREAPAGGRWRASRETAEGVQSAWQRRREAEEQAAEERKEALKEKLAALAEKAEAEKPTQPSKERTDRDRAPRARPRGRDWADEEEAVTVAEVTVLKDPDEPLGVICQTKTLRVLDVKPRSACWKAGIQRYKNKYRLTHVNGEEVSEMSEVRYIVAKQGEIKLRLDTSLSEVEKEQQRQDQQPAPEEGRPGERDFSALRGRDAPPEPEDHEDEVEPEEDFYACHKEAEALEEEEEEEECEHVFQKGDKVILTDEGVEAIEQDNAWAEIPLRPGQVGTVVGYDEEDDCPVVQGPMGMQKGLHPLCLRLATKAHIDAAALLAAEERRKQEEAERERARRAKEDREREMRCAQQAKEAVGSNLDPTAPAFVPQSLRHGAPQQPAGPERRLDPTTGQPATEEEFLARYSRKVWENAVPALNPVTAAVEKRIDPYNGTPRTELEFLNIYGVAHVWQRAAPAGAPSISPAPAAPAVLPKPPATFGRAQWGAAPHAMLPSVPMRQP